MQIIVIGNGYDIASGLPTQYIDYFDHFELKYSDMYEQISKLIQTEVSVDKSTIDLVVKSITLTPENLELINAPLNVFLNNFKNSNMLKMIIENKISIWNLFFWFKRYSFSSKNWHSVEEMISTIINFRDARSVLYFEAHKLDNINTSVNLLTEIKEVLPNKYKKLRVDGSKQTIELQRNHVFKSLIATILDKRYESAATNLFEIYKMELMLLENDFRDYV